MFKNELTPQRVESIITKVDSKLKEKKTKDERITIAEVVSLFMATWTE